MKSQISNFTDTNSGRQRILVAICMLIMTTLLLANTPFDQIFRYEYYWYILKAFEINHGNWTPLPHHAYGWPIVLAIVFKLFGIKSIFTAMSAARVVSLTIIVLCIIPLYKIALRTSGQIAADLTIFSYAFSGPFIGLGGGAVLGGAATEPLFLLLALCMLNSLLEESLTHKSFYIASVFAGLSWWVRPNGFVFIAVALIYLIVMGVKKRFSKHQTAMIIVMSLVIFTAVSLPMLVARKSTYGGILNYGVNSKYLTNSNHQAWSYNVPTPTLGGYLRSHSRHEMMDKFIKNGLMQVVSLLPQLLGIVWIVLFLLGIIYAIYTRDTLLTPVYIFLTLFFLGLVPVFAVFTSDRYLVISIPFIYLISIRALLGIFSKPNYQKVMIILFACLFISESYNSVRGFKYLHPWHPPVVKDEWALWAAQNLKERISIDHDFEIIDMAVFHSESDYQNAIKDLDPLTTVKSPIVNHLRITFIKPGEYADYSEFKNEMHRLRVRYVFLSDDEFVNFPYLQKINDDLIYGKAVLVKNFVQPVGEKWEIPHMRVYKLLY